MSDPRPIGVFDSGLGGLTVVKEIIKTLPNENIVYLGDTARVPYGTRSKDTVIRFSLEDADFLIKKGVKCIVIACNTSSALAGGVLKRKLKVPVFEVVAPALKKARSVSKTGRIGVIGTRGTIGSGAYKVSYSTACPLLVPFIEEGEIKSPALKMVAEKYLEPLKNKKIDTLILGCTHYPIIQKTIEKIMGKSVRLVNPEAEVVVELRRYLEANKLNNPSARKGIRKYYVTDFTTKFKVIAEMFLGHSINGNLKKVKL